MLNLLELTNFKCFDELSLPLGPLTLLAGMNSSGKSTALQAVLLLRQSAPIGSGRQRLQLNGELANLGTVADVLYTEAATEEVVIQLGWDDGAHATWRLRCDLSDNVLRLTTPVVESHQERPPFAPVFTYLSAERLGPRTQNAMSDYEVLAQRDLGAQGEHALQFLDLHRHAAIPILALALAEGDPSLVRQVEAWLGVVSPGIRLNLTAHAGLDAVQARFGYPRRDAADPAYHRATNTGFGVSFVLPVLLAVLSAPPGALLLVENPEAHLHPRGQRLLGGLLARAAQHGQQIIVETHSDHILNGVRVAAYHREVDANKVRLHWFERREGPDGAYHVVTSPAMDQNGRIDWWPEGFFDEWERALKELLRPEDEAQ